MGITEAGRKFLEPDTITEAEQFAQRGKRAQASVDGIMADANRNLDLKELASARSQLTDLDRQRARLLYRIGNLVSRLGVASETRELL